MHTYLYITTKNPNKMKEKRNEQKTLSVFDVRFLFQRPGCILCLAVGDYSQRNEAACRGRCIFSIMGFIVEFLVHMMIIY